MVIVDEEKEKFAKAEKLLKELESALDLPALKARKKELEEKQNEEGFWNDVQHAQTVNRELSRIDGKIDGFFKLKARAEDAEALIALVEEAKKICNKVKIFIIAANLGDARSLIIHPASTTHSQLSESELKEAGISPCTVRLSIGLESSSDLIADLKQAIEA